MLVRNDFQADARTSLCLKFAQFTLSQQHQPHGNELMLVWWGVLLTNLLVAYSVAWSSDAPPASSSHDTLTRWKKLQYTQRHMGVDVSLTLYAVDASGANEAAERALARIAALDAIFSNYRDDSEATHLAHHAGHWQSISPEMYQVLQWTRELSEKSQGAFDVTIGPLTKLWRRARRQHHFPDPQQLEAARRLVNYRLIELSGSGRAEARLLRSGMQLDFGGIVKGYAADEALLVLKQHGFPHGLVAVAGDLALGDAPPGSSGWTVGVHVFSDERQEPDERLLLQKTAVSTSGDAYQFLEHEGIRYSHIIDPRTGRGTTHICRVTVIAPTGWLADALATAISVLGPEEGSKLLKEYPQTAASITYRDNQGKLHRVVSPHWPGSHRLSPAAN
ncbi:MAG: thiamine biosynthesis lipoprotein ApbE [Planctomycetaceae bacterium]|nr:MAG: thiamine biosynthesis lipoprotein ApbE [Planctomycetaceae bacterium]